MPIDLRPAPVVEHLVNEAAADTVGRPPLLDVVNAAITDLTAPCDRDS